MIESKEILWIVIAISVAILTGFFAWVLFQVGRLLKQSNEIVEDVRLKLASITEMVSSIGEKINRSTSTITVMAKGLEQVLSYVKTKRQRKNRPTETD